MAHKFHAQGIDATLNTLKVDPTTGLTQAEAATRLSANGPNKLAEEQKKSLAWRILMQFKDFLVIILIIAAAISTAAELQDGFDGFSDLKDALLILGILLVNVIISITQENRADNALKELKNLSSPKAKAKRNGVVTRVDSIDVVTGDIIVLDAGDYIPADLRIIESMNLKVDEAALTGESLPVSKYADKVVAEEAGIGDRVNLASMGTVVTYGRGVGVVYATGMDTEMGKIATMLGQTEEGVTPLQEKLNAFAKTLGIVCIITCALVFGVGFLYNWLDIGVQRDVVDLMLVSVSLAVAAVPEGVAIVATVILAIGVQKMVKQNVIVKRLRAVETLGSTTVICSDKTGTLTQNKMTVVKVFDTEKTYEVTGTGYAPTGEIVTKNGGISKNIELMAKISILCNDAIYNQKEASVIGDPTEAAMLVLAAKVGITKEALENDHKRLQEIPFDSSRKLMSTYNIEGNHVVMNTKGAPDAIIHHATHIYADGTVQPMTDDVRARLLSQNEQFASEALRVLGFAFKEFPNIALSDVNHLVNDPAAEQELVYVGMMCMIDPPRDEVKESIEQCHDAGINVKMITGDHKTTAAAIATNLGIMFEGDEALSGHELNALSDAQLTEKVKTVNVFARVSPEHKVRIVDAVNANNNIVAMTGDGVNDAPSIKKADIGIAMGITGTDVTKEAADMILTDDNFVSIVGAVEQGRTIYGNIRKVTGYLLACNIGEILIILLAIVFALPVPLVATQLLFVNLLTDAFPAFALGMEGKEPGVMKRAPRNPSDPIINKDMRANVAARAICLMLGSLGAFLAGYLGLRNLGLTPEQQLTLGISMCFFTLVAAELLLAFTSKSESFIGIGARLFNNRFLNISTILSLSVLLAVFYIPFLADLFSVVPLSLLQLAICIGFILFILLSSELAKKLHRPTKATNAKRGFAN